MGRPGQPPNSGSGGEQAQRARPSDGAAEPLVQRPLPEVLLRVLGGLGHGRAWGWSEQLMPSLRWRGGSCSEDSCPCASAGLTHVRVRVGLGGRAGGPLLLILDC